MARGAHMDTGFKERCIGLRRNGYTLLEIARLTGRSKTTVYFHIRHIPLRADRISTYRKKSGERIRQFAIARKGKSVRPFRTFSKWTPRRVLLVAHLLFDGEITRGKCVYNNRSEELVRRFENLMAELYSYPPRRYVNQHTGVIRAAYFNVALASYLYLKSQKLLETINGMNLARKKEFLRAFFDDEGCITLAVPKKRQVRGYQKDARVLTVVQNLLSDLAIDASFRPPNEVVISGKENLLKFQKEINFSPGVRINGNRSNSLWKESLEKRELLDRAIKSFKT